MQVEIWLVADCAKEAEKFISDADDDWLNGRARTLKEKALHYARRYSEYSPGDFD